LAKGAKGKVAAEGSADIIVGIPSFDSAETIGAVVKAAKEGASDYFPERKTAIVIPGADSADGTLDAAMEADRADGRPLISEAAREVLAGLSSPPKGPADRGWGVKAVLEVSEALDASACAVLDAGLKSAAPQWLDLLLRPVLQEGFDYVAPCYLMHKYDGTITSTIVYPLTRALYGLRIRQPIGWDVGLSRKMAGFLLSRDVWETDVARFAIDVWMTSTSAANGFRTCQSYLGQRLRRPGEAAAELSQVLSQVMGGILAPMEEYEAVWKEKHGSVPVESFGTRQEMEAGPVGVNVDRMVNLFRLGMRELGGLWEEILDQETLGGLRQAAARKPFSIGDGLWAMVIYDFVSAWHNKVMNREHILKTLTPLYLGKVASLVAETAEDTPSQAEQRLEALCLAFEEKKPYLIERWTRGGEK
jgi:hypothetical protein